MAKSGVKITTKPSTNYDSDRVRFRMNVKYNNLHKEARARTKSYMPKQSGATIRSLRTSSRKKGKDVIEKWLHSINWNNNKRYKGKGRYNYKYSRVAKNRNKHTWSLRGYLSAKAKMDMSLNKE